MLNVNELKRNAKNIVKKYSDAQVKVREATSNDPWGPSSTIMAEIADLTYNVVAFSEIMQMIWKRLNDHGKNWRHVFKSLVLLEYLIKTGNEKVAQQCIENIFAIQTLKDFQYVEENKDHGMSIRDKSKKLVALLKDPDRLKAERSRALKAKSRAVEAVSSGGKSSFGSMMSRSSSGSGDVTINTSSNGNNISNNSGSFSGYGEEGAAALATDLDSARPQTATEEETQLQIALALSKEEAERMEKTRKNDELRLKLALDVSKQTVSGTSSDFLDDFEGSSTSMTSGSHQHQDPPKTQQQQQPAKATTSNIDDLLGLSFTPDVASTSVNNTNISNLTTNNLTSTTMPAPSPFASSILTRLEPQNDPWSADPWKPINSQALPTQSTLFNQVPGHNTASTISTTLPTTATTVPNPFPISNTSIFSPDLKKPMSKNPFED
uniref:Epsin-2 n=1 Tax=Aceria tosichella TaxID=561515 RepID=A0A6G1S5P7_9ACAR